MTILKRNGLLLLLMAGLVACGGDETEVEVAEAPVGEGVVAPPPTMSAAPAADAPLLDANSATAQEMVAAGVPAPAADAIVAGRPYQDVLALDAALAGQLDEPGREAVYRSVWIPLDLNSASAEEIMLIPEMSERMVHEFEEYRPYRAMDQFRTEIGKYVDQDEVARLERYVTIR